MRRRFQAGHHRTVIVFSSSGHEMDVERAYRLGANSFEVMPAEVPAREEFARAVKDYWLRFHEFAPMSGSITTQSLPLAQVRFWLLTFPCPLVS